MTNPFFFDVEAKGRPAAKALLKPARNLVDPVKIQRDLDEKAERMALNPNFADIIAIGWFTPEQRMEPLVFTCDSPSERRDALTLFWEMWTSHPVRVGFNCLKYDLPVLIRQSQLLRVRYPEVSLNRYRADSIDLMNYLTFQGEIDALSLTSYCALFGYDGTDDDHKGNEIAALYAAGDWTAIRTHCSEDLRRTYWLAARVLPEL